MLGSKRIHLTEEEFKEYQDTATYLSSEVNRCKELLTRKLQHQMNPDLVSHLQFELAQSGKRRPTDADKLEDDSWLLARFKSATYFIYKSSKEMKQYELRDQSEFIEERIKNIISTISNTLEDNDVKPPPTPDFPGLEKKLGKITEMFLEHVCPGGHCNQDQTDDSDKKTLLYLVRNLVIVREFGDMILTFIEDITRLGNKHEL